MHSLVVLQLLFLLALANGTPVVAKKLLGSRYSYLASTQLDRIALETGATINWIPIFSEELRAPAGKR